LPSSGATPTFGSKGEEQIMNFHRGAFEVLLEGGTSGSGIFRGDGATTTPIALRATAAAGTTETFVIPRKNTTP